MYTKRQIYRYFINVYTYGLVCLFLKEENILFPVFKIMYERPAGGEGQKDTI